MSIIILDPEDEGCHALDCHGAVDPLQQNDPATYLGLIKGKRCCWDYSILATTLNAYEHDGGWSVRGYKHKLWLSVKCLKCGYDWSLNKLGVPQEY